MTSDPNRYYVNGRAYTLQQAIKVKAELKKVEPVKEPIVEKVEAPTKEDGAVPAVEAKAEKPIVETPVDEATELEKVKLSYEIAFGKKPHHKKTLEILKKELAELEKKTNM